MAKMTTKELVRFSYVTLIEPKAAPGSTTEKYSISVIIPKTAKQTLKAVQEAIAAAEKEGLEKFGSKWKAKKLPLRDGDDEKEDAAYKDSHFFNASSKNQPGMVDGKLQKILDPAEIKSGDWGNLSLNFYPFSAQGNMGVAVGLNHVQKCKDGDPLGANSNPEDEFGTFQEEEQY